MSPDLGVFFTLLERQCLIQFQSTNNSISYSYFVFTTVTYFQNIFVKKDIVFMAKKSNGIEPESLKVHLIMDRWDVFIFFSYRRLICLYTFHSRFSDKITITAAVLNTQKMVMRRFPLVRSVGRYFT